MPHARENTGSDVDETIVWKTQEVIDISDDHEVEIGQGGVDDLGVAEGDVTLEGDVGLQEEEVGDDPIDDDEEAGDDNDEFFEAEYEVVQGPAPWASGGGSNRAKGEQPSLGGRVMVDADGG